jgi:hypothetical protein
VTIEVDDDNVGQFIVEVLGERVLQDNQWGGSIHDDQHSIHHWAKYLRHQVWRATHPDRMAFERRMVKVAALAMAAFESNRRKHGTGTR